MLDPKALWGLLDQPDPQERMGRLVRRVPPDHRAMLVPLVTRVPQEQRVQLVPQVRRVR